MGAFLPLFSRVATILQCRYTFLLARSPPHVGPSQLSIVRPQKQVSFERWVHLSSSSSCPRRTLRASRTPTHTRGVGIQKNSTQWTEIHQRTNFPLNFHLDAALFGFGLLKKIFAFLLRLKGSFINASSHNSSPPIRGSSLLLIPPLLSSGLLDAIFLISKGALPRPLSHHQPTCAQHCRSVSGDKSTETMLRIACLFAALAALASSADGYVSKLTGAVDLVRKSLDEI